MPGEEEEKLTQTKSIVEQMKNKYLALTKSFIYLISKVWTNINWSQGYKVNQWQAQD